MGTPNGRFETGKKICLSISGYHPETWQPSWSIRTALLAIIGFMPTPGQGTIGSLDYPPEERKKLAKKSTSFSCDECCSAGSSIIDLLKSREEEQNEDSSKAKEARAEEAKKLASQISIKVRVRKVRKYLKCPRTKKSSLKAKKKKLKGFVKKLQGKCKKNLDSNYMLVHLESLNN